MQEKRLLRHNAALLLVISLALCCAGVWFGMDRLMGDMSGQARQNLSTQMGRLQHAVTQRDELWSGRFVSDLLLLARNETLRAYVNDVRHLALDLETLRALSAPALAARRSVIAGLTPRLRADDLAGVRAFADHSVFVRQQLMDSLRGCHYARVAVLNADCERILATDERDRRLTPGDSAMLHRCLDTGLVTSLPAYRVADTLRVDVAVPLFADVDVSAAPEPEAPAPGAEPAPRAAEVTPDDSAAADGAVGVRGSIVTETRVARGPEVVAMLLVTMDLRERMEATAALSARPATGGEGGETDVQGGVTHILAQQNADGSLGMLTYTGDSVSMPLQDWKAEGDMILFDLRGYPGHRGQCYTVGQRLATTSLFCVVALDEGSTMDGLLSGLAMRRWLAIAVVCGCVIVLLICWLLFFSSREKRVRHMEIAVADRHNRRRQVLGYLDQELRLPIMCSDFDHNLIYVNEAFARLAGHYASELRGRPVENLPQDMATNILRHCEAVWNSGAVHVFDDRICCAGSWRSYRVIACPYEDRDHYLAGVIGIYEDVTEREQSRERVEALGEQTVIALHRLIMAIDGHLGRQSTLIAELATLTARLDGDESRGTRRLLSMAGRLCRLGLLPGTADAAVSSARHITIAGVVLGSVDFEGLPVTQAISDMYERLDGSGEPRGLTADGIGKPARCLAIADELARALMPREGRPRPVETFFADAMAEQPARLDPALMEKLRAFLVTPQGRNLLKRLLA